MGFFTFAAAGAALIVLGTFEALSSSPPSPPPPLPPQSNNPQTTPSKSSFLYFLLASLLSFLFILNSLISFLDAINSNDRVGSAQQLQVLAIAALFLLYSITGLLVNSANSSFPSPLLNLIGLFAFVEEFMYFYLQRKDTVGIENRYFDLLLVPIFICVFSTLLELHDSRSSLPKLGRGVGLVFQGVWFLQMGFSIYTHWMANGCTLREKSRGNYTVRCKGHPEYHRARAIATLQFNCCLALVVVLVVMCIRLWRGGVVVVISQGISRLAGKRSIGLRVGGSLLWIQRMRRRRRLEKRGIWFGIRPVGKWNWV